jgi:hypothetical protein
LNNDSSQIVYIDSDASSATVTPAASDDEVDSKTGCAVKKVGEESRKVCQQVGKVELSRVQKATATKRRKVLGGRRKAYEVFCGCARLTKALCLAGFDATGVDCKENKDRPESKSIVIDLGTKYGQRQFSELLHDPDVDLVTFAPPCGTASRSREIRRKDGPDPKPLRSDDQPDGLPSLTGVDYTRVQQANELYVWVVETIFRLDAAGISWVVENPTNSLMWKTSGFQMLLSGALGVEFRWSRMQMCMHGGHRDKKTSLLYGGDINLDSLAVLCDGKHEHMPWGLIRGGGQLFATASERNYPATFCERFAQLAARSAGLVVREKVVEVDQVKVAAGKQARRDRRDVVPEFSRVCPVFGLDPADVRGWRPGQSLGPFRDIPEGSKLLDVKEEVVSGSSKMNGKIGFAWSKEAFVAEAKKVNHPFDDEIRVPQRVAQILFDAAANGPDWVKSSRASSLAYYSERATALECQEQLLHSRLNANVEKVVSEKRILLFQEMLSDIGYDDMEVVSLLSEGVKVVGKLDEVGIWKKDDSRGPRCSVKDVWLGAREAQAKVLTPRKPQDQALEEEVWKGTLKEVDDGVLKGPMTPAEVSFIVGPLWVAARRFGLKQGQKIRPIDNFSEFSVNAALGASERITMLGIDHVVAWSRARVESQVDSEHFEVLDTSGQRWTCRFHESWKGGMWTALVGRVADLANAYKQVAVHPASRAFSIVAVQDPTDGKMKLFEAISLMFGETAAVYQ